MNTKSVTVSTMFSYFVKFKIKLYEKSTGMEPGNDLFTTTIMGTGKSIDFFIYLFKVGCYPLLTLACTCYLNYIAVVYCL